MTRRYVLALLLVLVFGPGCIPGLQEEEEEGAGLGDVALRQVRQRDGEDTLRPLGALAEEGGLGELTRLDGSGSRYLNDSGRALGRLGREGSLAMVTGEGVVCTNGDGVLLLTDLGAGDEEAEDGESGDGDDADDGDDQDEDGGDADDSGDDDDSADGDEAS